MFMLIVLVVSLTLTGAVSTWLKVQVPPSGAQWQDELKALGRPELDQINMWFGSLPKTTYTLVQLTLNGMEWGDISNSLFENDFAFLALLVIAYVIFTIVAMLNIFTGVFVDNAVQNSKRQRDVQLETTREEQKEYMEQLMDFFLAADTEGKGSIDVDDIEALLDVPKIGLYFSLLGFQRYDAKKLFSLIDSDCSGSITWSQFLAGCDRMKGPAREIDVQYLISGFSKILEDLEGVTKIVTRLSAISFLPSSEAVKRDESSRRTKSSVKKFKDKAANQEEDSSGVLRL